MNEKHCLPALFSILAEIADLPDEHGPCHEDCMIKEKELLGITLTEDKDTSFGWPAPIAFALLKLVCKEGGLHWWEEKRYLYRLRRLIDGFEVLIRYLAAIVLSAIVACLVGALVPSWQAARLKPVETLQLRQL